MDQTEFQYRKVRCNDGHWSEPFPAGGSLPKACPVCGMPYDRRQNRPVPCHADGRTAEDTEPVQEQAPEPEVSEPEQTDDGLFEPFGSSGPAVRRQASAIPGQMGQTASPTRRRVIQPVGEAPSVQSPRPEQAAPAAQQYAGSSKGLVLYTCGQKIPVPDEGGYLGREELGGELFGADFLISRRHCYIRPALHAELQVQDSGSLNGTFTDDGSGRKRLREGETVLLKPGSKLYLADLTVVVAVEENV